MQVYYHNSISNESSWSKPGGFSGEVLDTKPTSQLRVPGTSWFEIHCEDGRKYYYNDVSEVILAPKIDYDVLICVFVHHTLQAIPGLGG